MMKRIYLAPMEGLTTRIFRQAFGKYYGGVDKCFTPFLSPNQNMSFQKRELDEVCDKDRNTIETVPQLICCNADHFIWAAGVLAEMGYSEDLLEFEELKGSEDSHETSHETLFELGIFDLKLSIIVSYADQGGIGYGFAAFELESYHSATTVFLIKLGLLGLQLMINYNESGTVFGR